MTPDIKAKWVAGLRGGKYAQGQVYLRDKDDNFCCLGVLADLLAPEDWTRCAEGEFRHGSEHRCVCMLPGKIVRETALGRDALGVLIEMNDDQRKSFAQIADWIEANL